MTAFAAMAWIAPTLLEEQEASRKTRQWNGSTLTRPLWQDTLFLFIPETGWSKAGLVAEQDGKRAAGVLTSDQNLVWLISLFKNIMYSKYYGAFIKYFIKINVWFWL